MAARSVIGSFPGKWLTSGKSVYKAVVNNFKSTTVNARQHEKDGASNCEVRQKIAGNETLGRKSSTFERASRSSEQLTQTRRISKSLNNLKSNKRQELEEVESVPQTERPRGKLRSVSAFRYPKSEFMTLQDEEPAYLMNKNVLADTLESASLEEETQASAEPIREEFIHSTTRYELTTTPKELTENVFNVAGYLLERERNRPNKLFPHLQPNNIKPFGSTDTLFFPEANRSASQIVYPLTKNGRKLVMNESADNDDGGHQITDDSTGGKKYTNHKHKVYPIYEQQKKLAACDGVDLRKNFSTASNRKDKPILLKTKSSGTKKSLCDTIKGVRSMNSYSALKERIKLVGEASLGGETLTKNTKNTLKYKAGQKLNQNKKFFCGAARNYSTCAPKSNLKCPQYVTVKLKEFQEECIKSGKCKPKPKKTGRLPKFIPMDCPCVDPNIPSYAPPLVPLKKRFEIKDKPWDCDEKICEVNERADANYRIKKKTLPNIPVSDCPCEQRQMTDFKIKRLPKIKVKEPPKTCGVCLEVTDCCTPRADEGMIIERKVLPVLKSEQCKCIEPPKLIDVPLRRLKARSIPEPKKETCDNNICEENTRADHGLEIKPKRLPKIKPANDCPCIEEPMKDVEPLKRLEPRPVKEPVKICPVPFCDEMPPRADHDLLIESKQLPRFVSQNCPCIDPPKMNKGEPIRRLIARPVEEKPKVCIEEVCEESERADAELKVESKRLPKLVPHECECIDKPPPIDVPLRRLNKVKVEEPPRICPILDDCLEAVRADVDDWMYWKCVDVQAEPNKKHEKNLKGSKNKGNPFGAASKKHYSTHHIRTPTISANLSPLILKENILESRTVDYVGFIVIKKNDHLTAMVSSNIAGIAESRFISTYKPMQKQNKLKDHVPPPCECPSTDEEFLQPKYPFIKNKEKFIPYPGDEVIYTSRIRGKSMNKRRMDDDDDEFENEDICADDGVVKVSQDCSKTEAKERLCQVELADDGVGCGRKEPKLTLWEKVVKYFSARPGCPTAEELRMKRLRDAAEKAASQAGLCVYDPSEECRYDEKELPKVIMVSSCKNKK